MLVTPLSRSSLLIGRALKEMVPLVGQAVIIDRGDDRRSGSTCMSVGALIGLALLAVFGIGLGSFSYALAIAVRKQDWMFWVVQQTFLFPLMILSGMLLPLETGPEWMQVASKFNPLTYLVDAERALFAGDVALERGAVGLGRRDRDRGRRADRRHPVDAPLGRLTQSGQWLPSEPLNPIT